jgi:hypothetical protein
MTRIFAVLVLSAATFSFAADDITMRTVEPEKDDSFIPARLPGFELRELSKQRMIAYAIDSETEVRLHVPLLVYFPVNDGKASPHVPELRRIYNDLAAAAARTGDPAIQSALLRLDRILADLGEKRDVPPSYTSGEAAPPQKEQRPRVVGERRIPEETIAPIAISSPTRSIPVEPDAASGTIDAEPLPKLVKTK